MNRLASSCPHTRGHNLLHNNWPWIRLSEQLSPMWEKEMESPNTSYWAFNYTNTSWQRWRMFALNRMALMRGQRGRLQVLQQPYCTQENKLHQKPVHPLETDPKFFYSSKAPLFVQTASWLLVVPCWFFFIGHLKSLSGQIVLKQLCWVVFFCRHMERPAGLKQSQCRTG